MTRTTFTKAYICLLFKTQCRQDQGEAYRDTKRGLFKGLSWDNWAAHWEQGELETELHGVQCSGSHLGLKITECYNCERLGKLEPEVLCKAKKVANGHWPSKDNDVTSQVKWKCWSSSGREGFFTTFLTTDCMCGRVVMLWVCGHVVMWVWVWVWVWAACLRTSYLFLPLPPPPAAAYWLSITDIVPEPSPVCIGQVLLLQTESVWFIHTETVINIWCHVSVIDFFEPIIPPAMWDFFTQPRSSDEDQMLGRPNFLNVHFTAFEYISHNMWYIFKCSFKITRAWRLVKSGSLDQQAGEMPDLDSDASREKVRDLELGFEFTGSPVQVCC